jgi:hypothetical protein
MLRIITGTSALEPVFAEVQTIRAGEVCLVGISGEPFFSIGQCIARLSNIRNTWVLGYCNAYSGYHPTAKAYTEGGYEYPILTGTSALGSSTLPAKLALSRQRNVC